MLRARRSAEPTPALAFDSAITAQLYAGHYLSSGGAPTMDFEVSVQGGQVSARLEPQPLLPVFPVAGKADRFAWDVVAAELQFERDAAGAVTALVLHQNGQAIRAVRSTSLSGADKAK